MIEFQYNGYNVRILGDIINISLDNDLILVYSDQHGEQIYGHRTPTRIVEVREVRQHVREQASME